MMQHEPVTTDECVELPVVGARGEILVSAYVDDDGFPVVTIINEGMPIFVSNIAYNGAEQELHRTKDQVLVSLTGECCD
ncbi:MAG TPA: hypothetical protein VH370_03640 [Humisphaera sp.]|jgi:hypothetical protein|nr:hypothetical protein [Humisphaera sp.]